MMSAQNPTCDDWWFELDSRLDCMFGWDFGRTYRLKGENNKSNRALQTKLNEKKKMPSPTVATMTAAPTRVSRTRPSQMPAATRGMRSDLESGVGLGLGVNMKLAEGGATSEKGGRSPRLS